MKGLPIKLLSTKILEADIISEALASGLVIETIPFIKISTMQDTDLNEKLTSLSYKKIRAIFTSSNAVKALQELLPKSPEWTYSAIEGRTLKNAASYFGPQKNVVTGQDGLSLAKSLVLEGDTLDKVFFCGNKRLDVLPSYLKDHGVQLKEVILYKNEILKKSITEKYSGILFFSPSAVESFFSENPIKAGTLLFAFGESTKKALQTYSQNEIILNDKPNQAAFLENIIKYFKNE